jgi:hypothetical protein
MTTSESFINYLIALQTRPPSIRIGQHMFNILCDYNLQFCEDVIELDTIDPYYNDSNVPAFLSYVIENWSKYEYNNTNTNT